MPTGITPDEAHQVYLKKKKELPGLTPAAWRKAAAQQLGMDYNDFLAIWKQAQGKSKTVKMVAQTEATMPSVVGPGPAMKVPMKKSVTNKQKTPGQLLADIDEATDGLVNAIKAGDLELSDVDDIIGDMKAEYKGLINVSDLDYKLDQAKKQAQAAHKKVMDEAEDFGFLPDDATSDIMSVLDNWTATEATETAVEVATKVADDVADLIMTDHGPLNHDLAQSIYKKIKANTPNGTPAQWRHAAAEYLNVDYNDYLAAWKKPGTVSKSTKAKISKPQPASVPTSAHPHGKFTTNSPSPDELKQELAQLYGPGGNPNYITLEHNVDTGVYQVTFPQGLAGSPTSAVTQGIVKGLEDMGLKVKQTIGPNTWEIKSPGFKKPPKPDLLNKENPYNVVTYKDGTTVLDIPSGNQWTKDWARSVSSTALKAAKRYTTSAYRKINGDLRAGKAMGADMRALSEALQPVKKEFTVFRGCGDEYGRSLTIDAFEEGGLFKDKGFMSTAVTPESAWRGVKLIIHLPKGTKGMYIDNISQARGEMEYLLDAGTEFRVISVKKVPKREPYAKKYDDKGVEIPQFEPLAGEVHLVAIPH